MPPASPRPDDLCPRPEPLPPAGSPASPPLYLSSVYACQDIAQADAVLSGREAGYAYRRDGHPNAHALAEKCQQLHAAERAAVAASGMGALALCLLSQTRQGDHVVASDQLYGKSLTLLTQEAPRLGIDCSVVDACDVRAVQAACRPNTRLIVVETISNPRLRVADVAALAQVADACGARLLVDNTFASPLVCRPLELGAALVHESLTKIMNGHSDVLLGLLAGRQDAWERVPGVLSTWGWTAAPFDCWLAARGLATLHLRAERASANALHAAERLRGRPEIAGVDYPGLPEHPDHALAARQFGGRFGSMVTFHLAGGRAAADRFLAGAKQIPFCPSLGELHTTLSHPASTSHRALSPEGRAKLGISEGTIRLSVGTESPEFVWSALEEGLAAC
ncbi:MAG: aminotransferase class I/II-fold pyridoxal phosphate-dependent enzyme [Pirellulales bacterium]